MAKHSFPGVLAALVVTASFAVLVLTQTATMAEPLPQVPAPGMVTMVDLGAKKCLPCKMMAPIIEELTREYQGRAAIIFIDVWEQPDAGPQFNLRAIPTQIFYDAQGKESGRHEGFLDKQAIVARFATLGVR